MSDYFTALIFFQMCFLYHPSSSLPVSFPFSSLSFPNPRIISVSLSLPPPLPHSPPSLSLPSCLPPFPTPFDSPLLLLPPLFLFISPSLLPSSFFFPLCPPLLLSGRIYVSILYVFSVIFFLEMWRWNDLASNDPLVRTKDSCTTWRKIRDISRKGWVKDKWHVHSIHQHSYADEIWLRWLGGRKCSITETQQNFDEGGV